MEENILQKFAKLTTLFFDVDGVFSDATLIVSENDVQRTFNVRDGYAIQMALKQGYNIAKMRKKLKGFLTRKIEYVS